MAAARAIQHRYYPAQVINVGGLGLVGLFVVLLMGTNAAPDASPHQVLRAVEARLSEWQPSSDPLVTLPDGTQAKQSNVYGIEVGGTRLPEETRLGRRRSAS